MAAVSTIPSPRPLAIKITCGAEAAERANQAWTVAATAIAAGADVAVWLSGEAVWFAVRDRQPELGLEHATPVAELIETVRLAGRILVCTQCAARRELVAADLIEGPTIAGAATFVEAVLQPQTQALVY
jgi:predicted peroxiredoxin